MPAAGRLIFDERYRETVRLRDGTEVVVRPLCPSDKEMLRRGFEGLSPRSRFLRFFSAKDRLTDEELEALVSLDGVDRFALGAATVGPGSGEGRGLAVARFARLPERPEVAEAAVTVVDDAQGKGLGTLLLQRLASAARERGVERFSCEFRADNERIRGLVERLAPGALIGDRGFVRAEVPLPAGDPHDPPGRFDKEGLAYGLLAGAARSLVEVRLKRLVLKVRP